MTQTRKPFIVGIGGTQRPGSSSELALRHCLAAAEKAGAETDLICGTALELPLFDPGVTDRTPAALRLLQSLRRADGIVRGMLQHSRGSSGDWQATDLNALVEESLNLAYHGARAQDQDFKVTWELDLDRNRAPIEVVSQDVTS